MSQWYLWVLMILGGIPLFLFLLFIVCVILFWILVYASHYIHQCPECGMYFIKGGINDYYGTPIEYHHGCGAKLYLYLAGDHDFPQVYVWSEQQQNNREYYINQLNKFVKKNVNFSHFWIDWNFNTECISVYETYKNGEVKDYSNNTHLVLPKDFWKGFWRRKQ